MGAFIKTLTMATKYVTAKQLAEKLMENPNDIVCVTSGNFELGGATVPVRSFDLLRYKGRIKEESFRDAFDGVLIPLKLFVWTKKEIKIL